MDGAIDLDQLPIVVSADGVEIRASETGELTTALVRLAKGHDARPLFKGLPGDLCQCPHWGYVISGTLRVWTADGSDDLPRPARPSTGRPATRPRRSRTAHFLEISAHARAPGLYAHLAAAGG